MMLTCLLVALMLVLGIATLEGFLIVALLRQLPRWHWRLVHLRFHARYAYLLFRGRMWWSRMQCHRHLLSASDDVHEPHAAMFWTWSEMADALRAALATDIRVFCQAAQEVAA